MNYFIKYFVLVLLMLTISCEVDDICTETVLTPKLIIRFYDAQNPDTTKEVTGLYVWAEAKDSLYVNSTTDSIVLPLNTHFDKTKYLLSSNSLVDTLYLFYERQEIFVSRSCGFKYNFELTDETHIVSEWSDSLSMVTTPQLIKDESAAHIKIFY